MIEYTVEVYANGDKFWYLNGKRHREDGPACEYANGDKEWYLNGEKLTKKEWEERTKKTHKIVIELSDEFFRNLKKALV